MNQSFPMVSVVIPTHNRSHLLPSAINSVLAQSFRDFELIVVDDASSDGTKKVITDYCDNRLRFISHHKNKGGSVARNTGIQAARGRYVALLDDDDTWHPEKLDKQLNRFKQADRRVGVIYCGFQVLGMNGKICQETIAGQRGDLFNRLIVRNMIGGSSIALIRRECFEKVGLFDESLASCQDWDMWLRISESYAFDYVPDILVVNYLHGNQISTDFSKMIPGRTRMINKHMDLFQRHPEVLVIHLKRLGKLHCINGTWKEAISWFKKVLDINRMEMTKIFAWCLFELPLLKLFSRFRRFHRYSPGNME